MTTIEENNNKELTYKKLILTSIFLFVNILILLFLFSLYFKFGATPIIIFLIFLFAFLMFFTPILRRKRKSLYSRIFPDKKKAKEMQRRQKEFIRTRVEPKLPQQKDIKSVDLKIKPIGLTKQLIKKCPNCGMILGSFVKKCPACGKSVID
ncbi:MAG: hypothetical protein EU548_09460 [Promethearchaeota archaeon]|nr:MAG: hypothetical protein EU548_09460 [Candidatus Lokiarchaeota archaeon]